MRWRRYGDIGILVELDGPQAVVRWCAAVSASGLAVQSRPGWSSVLVTSELPVGSLVAALETVSFDDGVVAASRHFDVDLVYDGEDLDSVAERTNLLSRDVIEIHTSVAYTVVFLGFSRGFPYLSGLDQRLWIPRRDNPRARVPAGSVAIAAGQTGIYPQDSPGGWHLLGHTTQVFFDPGQDPPSVIQPGDQIRFVAR